MEECCLHVYFSIQKIDRGHAAFDRAGISLPFMEMPQNDKCVYKLDSSCDGEVYPKTFVELAGTVWRMTRRQLERGGYL